MPKSQDAAIKRLAPAVDRSRAEWRLLRARLSTITPQALGRGVLSTVVVVVAAVLARETWPALLPFAIGGLLAYTIYPIVDRLDRVMPRVLAAALALAGGLAVLVLVVRLDAPPEFLASREGRRLAMLQTGEQAERAAEGEAIRLARLEERLAASPNAARWDWETARLGVARELAGNSRAMLQLGGSGDIADALVTRAFMERDEAPGAAGAADD